MRQKKVLTVFKDEANCSDKFSAEQHDRVVSGGAGECLCLSVGVQDQTPALIQELLVGRVDVGSSEEQLLKECSSVAGRGT